MRFLLVLFALLSGLSLPEVANATTRTEVAGCAAVASVSAAAPTACVVAAARVMAARPVFDPAQGVLPASARPFGLAPGLPHRSDRARE
ncbi:hypothetical protein [Novosphingobium pituita]|uniref:Uncharacterized protein n=1 Tax=Novosphingobium pituita TaxID=3056842 RepID=A0ABQ6P4S9_9SPHN|nr:hypothetical protein [Novosphingobium sp. IK01]GMM60263.1 hypothetical protein NUTIK01_10400 [Novosphingobium sp. IK01]